MRLKEEVAIKVAAMAGSRKEKKSGAQSCLRWARIHPETSGTQEQTNSSRVRLNVINPLSPTPMVQRKESECGLLFDSEEATTCEATAKG